MRNAVVSWKYMATRRHSIGSCAHQSALQRRLIRRPSVRPSYGSNTDADEKRTRGTCRSYRRLNRGRRSVSAIGGHGLRQGSRVPESSGLVEGRSFRFSWRLQFLGKKQHRNSQPKNILYTSIFHWETVLLRPPVRVRGTSYRHSFVWCSPLTLLDVILKHFYFTRPFYHDIVTRPCCAPALTSP